MFNICLATVKATDKYDISKYLLYLKEKKTKKAKTEEDRKNITAFIFEK